VGQGMWEGVTNAKRPAPPLSCCLTQAKVILRVQ
jgi:hypothetical protein